MDEHEQNTGDTEELRYAHVDWDFDPEAIKNLQPEELAEYLVLVAEKQRRLLASLDLIAARVDYIAPRSRDITLRQEIDMVANPDKPEYSKRPELADE